MNAKRFFVFWIHYNATKDVSNDGMLDPIIEYIYQWQVKAYRGKFRWEYE